MVDQVIRHSSLLNGALNFAAEQNSPVELAAEGRTPSRGRPWDHRNL